RPARYASTIPGGGNSCRAPRPQKLGWRSVRNAPRPALRLFNGDSLLLAHLRPAEPCLRRSDARAKLDLDADVVHRHLGAKDRAEQHKLVQIAEMADAEQLAGHLRQTSAEREIIAAIGAIDDLRTIEAVPHHDRTHRVGTPLGPLGTELEAPG